MTKTETKPQTEVKPQGWDRKLKHFGTFTNFRKKPFDAYLIWVDDGETKRGFALMCAATHKEFIPGLLVMRPEHLKLAKADFVANGKTAPLSKEDAKEIAEVEEAEQDAEQAHATAKDTAAKARARRKQTRPAAEPALEK